MKIILTGGGTAGHVNPAVAIGEILQSNIKNCEIVYIARKNGKENSEILKSNFKIKYLDVCGLKRKISIENIKTLSKTIKAYKQSKEIIKEYKPDIIIGTGGYVSYPVLKAGQKLKVKTVIHESNAFPGLVTRMLQTKCDLILLNFEKAKEYLKTQTNTKVVGNPLRKGFSSISHKIAREKLNLKDSDILIVSFGGSGGAKKINSACINLMQNYSSKNKGIHHIHSVGHKNYELIKDEYKQFCSAFSPCFITPYIENMPELLSACDIAITRCGAVTLSELARCKVPSILIPSPNVTGNHQLLNAKAISSKNGAILIEEKDLNDEFLLQKVEELASSKNKRLTLSKNISKFNFNNTEEIILNSIKTLIQE